MTWAVMLRIRDNSGDEQPTSDILANCRHLSLGMTGYYGPTFLDGFPSAVL